MEPKNFIELSKNNIRIERLIKRFKNLKNTTETTNIIKYTMLIEELEDIFHDLSTIERKEYLLLLERKENNE